MAFYMDAAKDIVGGDKLHGPSMLAVEAKIYGVFYNQSSSIAFNETSSWSAPKSF